MISRVACESESSTDFGKNLFMTKMEETLAIVFTIPVYLASIYAKLQTAIDKLYAFCVYGSLRRNGSTPTLVKAFTEEAESTGNAVTGLWEDRACQEQPL